MFTRTRAQSPPCLVASNRTTLRAQALYVLLVKRHNVKMIESLFCVIKKDLNT